MVAAQIRSRGIADEAVLEAMAVVPRERFVPAEYLLEAYADCPLPIGHNQTISQPYIVALMLELLGLDSNSRVLDVGAGSGYQTALLARLAGEVYAIERINQLARQAEETLRELGAKNVTFTIGDGSLGWPEQAPFDRIICGAAAPEIPPAWIEQLADGGRIVAPVGGEIFQDIEILEKRGGKIHRRQACAVRFVRLIGKQGFSG
ncbi:MAG: protein-L-isoaspartate(D-aspartate) O-methyltransferase [Phycisphaerae bacterium]|nr:protein-L-isoaspartate(D-aspartate) O-methyltransferase [Phycisphaerae bacterium]